MLFREVDALCRHNSKNQFNLYQPSTGLDYVVTFSYTNNAYKGECIEYFEDEEYVHTYITSGLWTDADLGSCEVQCIKEVEDAE